MMIIFLWSINRLYYFKYNRQNLLLNKNIHWFQNLLLKVSLFFSISRTFTTVLFPNFSWFSITLLINFSPNKCSLLYYRNRYILLYLVLWDLNLICTEEKTRSSPQLLIQLLLLLLHLCIIEPFRNKCCHDTITMVLITKKG